MKNFTVVGRWWNDNSIELIEINSEGVFALHGWNGERYTDSWKVDSSDMTMASEKEYTVIPEYEEVAQGEFEIVRYFVEEN